MSQQSDIAPDADVAILSLTATTGTDLARVEEHAASDAGAGVVWVVRGTGSFVGLRVPPGVPPITSSTGYLVIDDVSGDVITMGMP